MNVCVSACGSVCKCASESESVGVYVLWPAKFVTHTPWAPTEVIGAFISISTATAARASSKCLLTIGFWRIQQPFVAFPAARAQVFDSSAVSSQHTYAHVCLHTVLGQFRVNGTSHLCVQACVCVCAGEGEGCCSAN